MPRINAQWQVLAKSAAEYCDLIEQLDKVSGVWLEQLSCLLPQIHSAVLALGEGVEATATYTASTSANTDYDRRFALYSHLSRLLGERDQYRMIFDSGHTGAMVSGSLADDITDIYFELKNGLEILKENPGNPGRAASAWRHSFILHWGQHLVDAERHLYELQVNNQLSRLQWQAAV